MKYRGVEYKAHDDVLETVPTEKHGKYRGADFQVRVPAHPPTHQRNVQLRYRGATYQSGQ